ncbi:MAG: chemotaxis protein CheA, partial [Planctomycetia bacterium]|nr:chemotaxis protein CheA [Planctomycetia bacterium]
VSPPVSSPINRGADAAPLANKSSFAVPSSASTTPSDSSDSPDKSPAQGSSVSDSSVRIDVSLLDKLMNLVGELVLARNQILQYARTTEDATITAASQRLNLITTELQEGVMKTRMQPIQNAWNKLPRVVRDLSAQLGKHIQVKMEGAETELDKTILEAIKDPLTHIVRNSVDHGIEASDVRVANGKSAEGTLWLRAFHEGGQVNIEISDDGGGINLTRVKEKALSQGMITAEQAVSMTERELTNLILLPGFSTAAAVTNVSGRGVGMDVVKTNVERIGGTLDIHSVLGKGTTLRIKIPLTLAIVPALTVSCGSNRFCIPQVNLLELVRLDGDRVRNEIELIHSVPVYRLRGQLLPLLYLDEQLKLHPRRTHEERQAEESAHIVVLQAEDRAFGLVVNSITDTQEIVVKPLGHHLKGVRAYAGATIMGDGTVSLILDVIGLAQQGQVLNEHRDHSNANADSSNATSNERQSWLVVDPGDGSQAAIDLGTVARLEEFQLSTIEHSGRDEVVQYRDRILPLLRLSTGFQQTSYGNDEAFGTKTKDSMSVVVYQHEGRQVGIVVGQIVDIVEHALRFDDGADPNNVVPPPSQVINGRVTQIIDLGALVASAM